MPGARKVQELQGKIQHHHRCVFNGDIANITFNDVYWRRGFIGVNMTTARSIIAGSCRWQ